MSADTLAVMPTYLRYENDAKVVERAIESFQATCDAELLVIDDGSPEWELVERLMEICQIYKAEFISQGDNVGFATTVNIGLRRARDYGQNALLVNADMTFMDNGWLDHLKANEADVVGGLLVYPNGLVQHAGVFYSLIIRRFDNIYRLAPRTLAQVKEPRICPVTGALMLIKHETLKAIGILDENFRFGYEDVDYCHMVFQAGMTCAYEPKAEVVHLESWFLTKEANKEHRKWLHDGLTYLHEKHKGRDFSEYIPTLIYDD